MKISYFVEKHYLDERRFYPVITDLNEVVSLFIATSHNDIWLRTRTLSMGSHCMVTDKAEGRSDRHLLVLMDRTEVSNDLS